MSGSYISKLGTHIAQMVFQKHAVGDPYKEGERGLRACDRFCAVGFPDAETTTPEIDNAWAVMKSTEKTSRFLDRLAPVRELARYINHAGIEACVIPAGLAPVEAQRYVPHILSLEERKRFFQATDSQPILPRSLLRHLRIPVIFRLMYTCGLRPHEARLIQKKRLNLLEGAIFIPESKGHKDCVAVIPSEVKNICAKYYPYVVHEFPDRLQTT